ncbi:hypothetical protein BKI52_40990 [marine bacterium AO1-C]|nr:hypothetical protein BKI52_40990 [marine bacterium AO1-C]
MKKQFITSLFLLGFVVFTTSAFAQEMTTFSMKDIKKLYLSGYFKVELVKGTEEKVEFNAPDDIKRLIKVKSNKGEIVIKGKSKRLKRLSRRRLSIRIHYKQLEAIKARNGVYVVGRTPLENKDFELVVIEGSQVDLKMNTKDLKARVSMGSEVLLEGTTDTFQVKVKMGSSLDAYGFKTNICYVNTGMGSDASVFAREAIYMSAGMGSSIKYRGSPKKVLKSNAWMGSDINRN